MKWCKKCVYPASSVNISFDEDGVCSGCHVGDERTDIDWDTRFDVFKEICFKHRSKDKSNYDCVIPVSGGKDSYYQTYIIKEKLGLNPLLVTYNGHNYLDVGLENLHNMIDTFGCDHIFFTPSKNKRIDVPDHDKNCLLSTCISYTIKINIVKLTYLVILNNNISICILLVSY